MFGHLRAAEVLIDRAGVAIADIYVKHGEARTVSEGEKSDAAEPVTNVKVLTTETAPGVTVDVFEVTGSRATRRKVGLDTFWRDVRMHALHDLVTCKNRELGVYFV